MLFSVDAHAIGRRLTGNEVYVRNLLVNFAALGCKSEFVAYLSDLEVNGWVPSGIRKEAVARNPFVRLGFDLARNLRRDRPDLIHVQYTAPLKCPVPVVVSVHDVSFIEHPEYFRFPRASQLRLTVKRTVLAAAKIITGSEFSRDSIARAYGLDPAGIAVIPNAASSIFRPLDTETAARRVFSRFGVSAPFLLTVGDQQPRKNHIGLIRAFAEVIRAHPGLRCDLVIAGKETWYSPRVRAAARESGFADRIHFTDFVTDENLLLLYNACDVFVFPSYYEGFGLPVLEAMACGRAVACSTASALPEVADAAAVLFDPWSTHEMARAVSDLLLDKELRVRMQRLGLNRAAQFSWRRTAERTLLVYDEVANNRKSRLGARQSIPVTP